ncbi:Uncharacterized protein dnm_007470 [Desulfonema magnum]|uniref:Uncharacterized protein n=1 Tax=Desulfonema magnum TaxID=45655 RepID=A0A975GKK9_9BACT|nr:Uncharacterized protein dnm_007470 [Desulfonema magnum]
MNSIHFLKGTHLFSLFLFKKETLIQKRLDKTFPALPIQ